MVVFRNFFVKAAVISGNRAQSQASTTFLTKGEIMNAHRHGVEPAGKNTPLHIGRKNQAFKFAGGIVLVTFILFVAAHWPQADLSAARPAAAASEGTTQPASTIDYFPAQFDSPARNQVAEEHIQAF